MKCHICNQPSESFIYKPKEIVCYFCKRCEYIFKSPTYYQDFQTQKERYNLHENNVEDEGYRAYFNRFLDFILANVDDVQTVLDFGCGRTSLLATLLEKKNLSCDYYDPIYHPKNLDETKKYDMIVSTEVFEHLHQPKEVFKTLLKHINRGGYLAIQTEFHSNDMNAFQKWWYPQDPTHIVFFRARTFLQLADMFDLTYIRDNGKNMVILQKVE